jgi:hypothetical protein
MITFEELAQQFKAQNVAPYGMSVVVPGKDFKPDWEHELGSQGCRFHFVELDGKQVTLVQRGKRERQSSEETVYSPQKTEHETQAEPARPEETEKRAMVIATGWTADEDELLIKLWNQKRLTQETISIFQRTYPKRSEGSITNHIATLKDKGRIKPRWTIKRKAQGKEQPEKTRKAEEPNKPTSTPTHAPAHAPAQKPNEQLVTFQSYCRKCKDKRDVEDSNVWVCCPVCRGPLTVWDINIKEAP